MKNRNMLKFFLCGAVSALAAFIINANNADPDGGHDECEDDDCCCCCDDETGSQSGCSSCSTDAAGSGTNSNKSVEVSINAGSPVVDGEVSGKIWLSVDTPSQYMYTPQLLRFSSILDTKIISDLATGLPSGVQRRVEILGKRKDSVAYEFATGTSIGTPTGYYVNSKFRLQMKDANGSPMTSGTPSFYDKIDRNGSIIRYDASTMKPLYQKTVKGRTIALDSPGAGIEIIRDNDSQALRQIKTPQSLTDIVVVNDQKYTVSVYAPENAGSRQNGFYVPTGQAHTVWVFENPETGNPSSGKLRVTKTFGSTTRVFDYEYTDTFKQWKLTAGGGLRVTTKTSMRNATLSSLLETTTVSGPEGVSFKKAETKPVYSTYGEHVTNKGVYADASEATPTLQTLHTYYIGSTYLRPQSTTYPDGSWEYYTYDSAGRTSLLLRPFKDAAYTTSPSSGKAEYYYYTPLDSNDVLLDYDVRPRTIENKVLGTTVSKTYNVYKTVNGEYTWISERGLASYGDSSNLRTTSTYYSESSGDASAGLLKTVQHPDGTLDTYSYDFGTYSSNPAPSLSSFSAGTGSAYRKTIIHGTTSSPSGITNQSTKETWIVDSLGNKVMEETYVYTGSGYERIAWTVRIFNNRMLPTDEYHSNGTHKSAVWGCCGKDSETLEDGTQITYSYDLLDRVVTRTKVGITGSQADIATTYTYDSSNRADRGQFYYLIITKRKVNEIRRGETWFAR